LRSRSLWRLRGSRGWWWRAPAVGAYEIFLADRALRPETDGRCNRTGPIWFAEDIDRLGEPAAVVLVLKDLRRVLATADEKDGTASKRKSDCGAATRQNVRPRNNLIACPLERILRHHDGTPQALVVQRVTRSLPSSCIGRPNRKAEADPSQAFFAQRPSSSACQYVASKPFALASDQ
jgi:hypothetical protein